MKDSEITLKSEADIELMVAWLRGLLKQGKEFRVKAYDETQRSSSQQASLEIYCREMAEKLNDAGYDQKAFLEKLTQSDIPNTQESVKESFKAIAKIMLPETMETKTTTTKLTTKTIQEVYEAFNRACAMRLGVQMEWPAYDNMIWGQREMEKRA